MMTDARRFSRLGITRRPDLDFADDGTRFTGYEYKGLPITYTKSRGYMYFSIRVDYLRDFAHCDYNKKDWYKLCDKFNGVESIDEIELMLALEKVVKAVAELKEEVDNLNLDFTAYNARKEIELEMIDACIKKASTEFNWLDASIAEVDQMKSCVSALKDYSLLYAKLKEENTPAMRMSLNHFESSNYIYVYDTNYYTEKIIRLIKKRHF